MHKSQRMADLEKAKSPISQANPFPRQKKSSPWGSALFWLGTIVLMLSAGLGVGWLMDNVHIPKPASSYVDNCHLPLPSAGYPVEGGIDPSSGNDTFVVYDSPNIDFANSFVAIVSDTKLQTKMVFQVEVVGGVNRKQPHKVRLGGVIVPWGSQCAVKVTSVAPA